MNFFHNRIANPVGDSPSFNEWLVKHFGAEQVEKTASEAKPGLGQDTGDEPRGQMRGQVINNDNEEGAHSYQEGESTDGCKDQGGNARPDTGGTTDAKDHKQTDKEGGADEDVKEAEVKEAGCGKEMGESDDAGKVTEDHTEAAPGDDEAKGDCKSLINNDPNYQKGESTDPGKVKGDNKKQPGDKVVASNKSTFKKVASLQRHEKLALFATLSAQKHPIEYCEAMVGLKFANLTPEEKEWFTNFWQILYPPEYVSEMVADR